MAAEIPAGWHQKGCDEKIVKESCKCGAVKVARCTMGCNSNTVVRDSGHDEGCDKSMVRL